MTTSEDDSPTWRVWKGAREELAAREMEFKYARALAIAKAEELLKGVPDDE